MVRLLFIASFLAGALVSVSCTGVNQSLDKSIWYKRDIQIDNMGDEGEGVVVLRYKPLYTIEFKSAGKLDLFTFSSCHREIAIENAKKGLNKKKVKINYKRVPGLEDVEACPIVIEAWEKKKGRHAWGYIDFEHPNLTLPIYLTMNGKQGIYKGVAAGQAPVGKIQKVEFDFDVSISSDSLKCKIDGRGRSYFFKPVAGYCQYYLKELAGEKRRGKLITFGYESVLLRDD